MTNIIAPLGTQALTRGDITQLRSRGYCCYPAADQQEADNNKHNLVYVTTMRRGHEFRDEVWVIWKSKTITTP